MLRLFEAGDPDGGRSGADCRLIRQRTLILYCLRLYLIGTFNVVSRYGWLLQLPDPRRNQYKPWSFAVLLARRHLLSLSLYIALPQMSNLNPNFLISPAKPRNMQEAGHSIILFCLRLVRWHIFFPAPVCRDPYRLESLIFFRNRRRGFLLFVWNHSKLSAKGSCKALMTIKDEIPKIFLYF